MAGQLREQGDRSFVLPCLYQSKGLAHLDSGMSQRGPTVRRLAETAEDRLHEVRRRDRIDESDDLLGQAQHIEGFIVALRRRPVQHGDEDVDGPPLQAEQDIRFHQGSRRRPGRDLPGPGPLDADKAQGLREGGLRPARLVARLFRTLQGVVGLIQLVHAGERDGQAAPVPGLLGPGEATVDSQGVLVPAYLVELVGVPLGFERGDHAVAQQPVRHVQEGIRLTCAEGQLAPLPHVFLRQGSGRQAGVLVGAPGEHKLQKVPPPDCG